jgi:Transposase DDE domain group 1
VLRPGNADSNTASDHIEATRLSLAQLPRHLRRKVLVRVDSAGGTHGFLDWLTARSRRLHYSAGMTITDDMQAATGTVPASAWTPAYDGDGQVRDGAWVADITGLLDLSSWPAGMRVIVRKEHPHPGAQLRFTDIDGHRFTASATDTRRGQLADLELRHRRRPRCEDRIRCAKNTGLRNMPLKGYAQNQVWCEIVALACELLAWTQMLALAGPGRRWEPKRLRLRLFSTAGPLVRGSRRLRRLPNDGPGPVRSPPRPPACRPSHPDSQPEHPYDQEGETPGPVEPRPPGATAGQPAIAGTKETHQPNTSGHHISHTKDGRPN